MSDPFSSWFVTLLRSQSTKRIGRLLDAERDQRVLAALAEDALRRAISVQQPHAPSEWLTETERALRELWPSLGSLPIDESLDGSLLERLALGVRATFAVLVRMPSGVNGLSQAESFDLDFHQLSGDFVVFFLRALETATTQVAKDLREVLAEGANELRVDQLQVSLNNLSSQQALGFERLAALLAGRPAPGTELATAAQRPLSFIPDRPSAPSRVWNIARLSQRLIGRGAAVQQLVRSLDESLPVVVTGTAGLGKSAVAAQCAWELRRTSDVTLGWTIRAEDEVTLLTDLGAFADALGLPDPEDLHKRAQLLVEYLEDFEAPRYVLIFDNAGDARQLDGVIPRGPGLCIVTSRTATGWYGRATVAPLEDLERHASIELLCELSGLSNEAEAASVVDVLGGNPLALENAARLTERMGWTFLDYVSQLDKSPDWALGDAFAPAEHSILRAMSTSVEQLSPDARQLLSVLAWFDPDSIPRTLIEGADAEVEFGLSHVRLAQATAALVRLSLIKPVPERATFWMHRVVQVAGRMLPGPEYAVEAACRLLLATWPDDPESPDQRSQADELVPHLSRVAKHVLKKERISTGHAEAALALIQYYRVSGGTREAFDVAEQLAALLTKNPTLVAQRARTSLLRGNLRRHAAERMVDRFAWGLARYREAVDFSRAASVTELEAEALMRFAYLRIQTGQIETGLPDAEAALNIGRREPNQRLLPTLLGLHVENLIRIGQYDRAYNLAVEMQAVVLDRYPAPHPIRSYAENQLAMASIRTNRHAAALEGYRRAVEEAHRALGSRVTDFLAIRYGNLAWSLLNMDRPEEALYWARRAIDVSTKVGSQPSALGVRYGHVAHALSLLRDSAADSMYRELEDMARASGPAGLASRLRMFARHLVRNGDPELALVKLREAQELVDSDASMRVEYVDEIRRDLGEAEALAGDPRVGVKLLREALQAFEQRAGLDHRSTALTRVKLARAIANSNPKEAAELACRGARELQAALGAVHSETRDAVSLCLRLTTRSSGSPQ